MDHDGWFGYTYPKNLGLHDLPKLGVAATVKRLEIAGDLDGAVYFHNVRVNGILAGNECSLAVLLLLLNSRLLDWVFRRGASDLANEFFTANKQFIAGLPIRVASGAAAAELEHHGRRLHELAVAVAAERGAFLGWLAGTMGASRAALGRRRDLARYDERTVDQVVGALARMRSGLAIDPREREPRELIEREHRASVERLAPLSADLATAEARTDDLVYDLYELHAAMRRLVDSEYE
jgi:hypothetical protein